MLLMARTLTVTKQFFEQFFEQFFLSYKTRFSAVRVPPMTQFTCDRSKNVPIGDRKCHYG